MSPLQLKLATFAFATGLCAGGGYYYVRIVMPEDKRVEEQKRSEEAGKKFFNYVPQKDSGNKTHRLK